jgi:hypothetical protein
MDTLKSKDVQKLIEEYPTKHKEGFIGSEIITIINKYGISSDAFFDALGVNTCMIIDGDMITYHCDIITALYCVLEDRDKHLWEWD